MVIMHDHDNWYQVQVSPCVAVFGMTIYQVYFYPLRIHTYVPQPGELRAADDADAVNDSFHVGFRP